MRSLGLHCCEAEVPRYEFCRKNQAICSNECLGRCTFDDDLYGYCCSGDSNQYKRNSYSTFSIAVQANKEYYEHEQPQRKK
mmetsp:Transcript_39585/g.35365  ORF Transcript_39585/g.35365 Transcript_39585/m.35365 type:complete len:81 (+) Transcript_39585:227-469(+)